ncbi:MAG TPA: tRNA (adenosine(37)-N6)-threonylcarbamoyltransferase complex transferase subunit TsaD [Spirochaetota bacterium]|nr:tRNA (adenosine(37)-N6)-threonylcarbamoyltransferase complex transferase subunit TsaD [Spirochaetota bacterium]HOL56785.1 tRNA (adenosine(37)-N6)-threonylcarbamoyltransferase complex transferase subunit TsaD [Spirochaetota bacterium]HPP04252.1 tRNA (adenosine(37)-N6)-threonylcarbamoyltransferase complex transferase subunit TsaD [Spirochaetota bacterium]
MLVLGIETTCDETSAAIVEDGKKVYSNVVSSQIKEHLPWQGVVPEIASRLHLNKIMIVVEKAIKDANISKKDIDLIAVANRPGLIGGLAVGVAFAKGFSFGLNKPLIAINHIEGHLYSPHITNDIEFPYIGLLVSGGHTLIVNAKSYTDYEIIGTTIDDAVGEAFDKIAKHYDLGYPGGPAIEKLAKEGDKNAFNFPISNLYKSKRKYDVSYSGIKTAVINYLEKYKKKDNWTINDIAASFQKRAFDILFKKVELASKDYNIERIVVAGGVSANQYLRELFSKLKNKKVYFPELKYATDNGAMIAAFAYHKFKKDGASSYDIGVYPRVQGYKISLEEGYRCR